MREQVMRERVSKERGIDGKYVIGFFAGMLCICVVMLVLPKQTKCEVHMMYDGGRVEVVHFGVVNKF